MMNVLNFIYTEHDAFLVSLALLLCLVGSYVTLRLLRRGMTSVGRQHWGWFFLAAVSGGGSIWATHFVAMLAYNPIASVTYDPGLTSLSLLIAMAGLLMSFAISSFGKNPSFVMMGGAFVGLSISAMHYTGMLAYRVVGLLHWDMDYILASIAISVVCTTLAQFLIYKRTMHHRHLVAATFLVVTGILGLHFTGMAAIQVTPMTSTFPEADTEAIKALAVAIALVALFILATGLTSYLIDHNAQNHSEQQLYYLASHDPMTALPNRASYKQYVNGAILSAEQFGVKVAIIRIDLNRFKEVNDRFGHVAGDLALKELAHRMGGALKENEFAARIGGDEFVAVKCFKEKASLEAFVDRLVAQFIMPVDIDGVACEVGASFGASIWPDDAQCADELIKNADLAMYHAKHSFLDSVFYYSIEIGAELRRKRQLAEDLKHAMERDELELHYQIQQSLIGKQEITGFEALLRWTHPTLGPISPAVFIPVAEENGLIDALGRWVLRRACIDAVSWNPAYRVAVNVSAVQFMDSELPRLVHGVLVETGLAPDRLELEMTETALVTDTARSLQIMRQVKALGVGVALDDFGTGYSSLDILRIFPIDKIKLDKGFVSEIEEDRQSIAIVRAVLALGTSLNIQVLAEGIETASQMAILREEGCDEGQGYLLGKPMSMSDLIRTEVLTDRNFSSRMPQHRKFG